MSDKEEKDEFVVEEEPRDRSVSLANPFDKKDEPVKVEEVKVVIKEEPPQVEEDAPIERSDSLANPMQKAQEIEFFKSSELPVPEEVKDYL